MGVSIDVPYPPGNDHISHLRKFGKSSASSKVPAFWEENHGLLLRRVSQQSRGDPRFKTGCVCGPRSLDFDGATMNHEMADPGYIQDPSIGVTSN